MKTLPLILSALLLAAALPAAAQQMNYQGRLTDASGNALADGQYTIEFSLWDAATAGTQVWGPYVLDGTTANGHGPKADLVNGRFNAVLGAVDTTDRPLTSAFSATRYLQIKVGTNSPITPRQAILDAPSALSARTAVTAVNAITAETADRIPNVFPVGANVGIGTSTPKQTLQVNGDLYAKGHVWLHAYEGDGQSGTAYLQARDDSATSNISLKLRTKAGSTIRENLSCESNGWTRIYGTLVAHQDIYCLAGISSSGDVGVGGNLTCSGTASKPGGGSWAALSDMRLKKDVRDLSGSLPKLLQLHSVTFDYKEPVRLGAKGRQTGFIAQEVEKVFPEWIIEGTLPGKNGDEPDATKYKSISITGFESLTVQALRELRDEKDTQIKTLTAENTSLRDTVKAQEARLAKLEQAVAALATAEEKPAKTTARR